MRSVIAAVIATILAFATQAAWSEGRVALVIGNSAYKESPLANPGNDASAMANALGALGFKVILRRNTNTRAMREAIREFAREARGAKAALFYYAGHGVQIKGANYLIPVAADIRSEADVEDLAIDANYVLRTLEEARPVVSIVILDACRNNPYASGFRSATRGLAQMSAATGTLIAFSTAPGSVALDGMGRNGLYTQHLLASLHHPDSDILKVFQRTRAAVVRETGGKQVPWESTSLTGDFHFRAGGQVASLAPSIVEIPQRADPDPVSTGAPLQERDTRPTLPAASGPPDRGYIGVEVQDVAPALAAAAELPEPGGAMVSSARKGGPADLAGIGAGDIIVSLGGRPVRSSADLLKLVGELSPGTRASAQVWRNRAARELELVISAPLASFSPSSPADAARAADLPLDTLVLQVEPRLFRGDPFTACSKCPPLILLCRGGPTNIGEVLHRTVEFFGRNEGDPEVKKLMQDFLKPYLKRISLSHVSDIAYLKGRNDYDCVLAVSSVAGKEARAPR